jgi:hypothetical protein
LDERVFDGDKDMEQIVVQIRDKHKGRILLELLKALDFVHTVKSTEQEDAEPVDFFSFSGLWANRDINIDDVRRKAWPRQSA